MKKLSQFKTREERKKFIEEVCHVSLNAISTVCVDEENDIRCENLIGAVSLPLGIAGPLKIKNSKSKIQNYYIPLATTEGALIASVNRGCKVISASGGVQTNIHKVGTTRGPVFYTGSIKNGQKFYDFIKKNQKKMATAAQKTSHHLILDKVDVRTVADYGFLRLYYDTESAMGMNMATIATQAVCQFIERETGFGCVSIAGNFDIDKKPAWLNFIEGRGVKVWAEISLSSEIIHDVLKTTPQKIFNVWYAKCFLGSAMSGSLGFNSHFANVVAAIFIATGQDPAHVTEGSMGITTTQIMLNGNLYVSVYLPDLMIGMVGGGTKLKTQRESLQIIGTKNVLELGEVIGGAVLAGEISLLASLAEGTLARAHTKLGR